MQNSMATSAPSVGVPDELQLGQFIPLHYHYNMLLDADRVGAFQAAIEQIVKPGMHVLELGAGTGVLSSFALRRGAQVTCVERNPVLASKTEELLAANGLSAQATVVTADACDFIPQRPVDVVICEMLHVAMLREKQLQVIDAFKRNYRAAFGSSVKLSSFIPEASILMWQPIRQSFDFAGYWAPVPMFQVPRQEDPRTCEIGPLDPYASISYESEFPLRFECDQLIEAAIDGEINAVRFITQNVLAIDMTKQTATTWPNQCLILPLDEPIDVTAGQRLRLRFAYQAGASLEDLAAALRFDVFPPAT